MATGTRPRTVLQVRRTDDGDVEITVASDEELASERQRLVVRGHDVAALIDLLRRYVEAEAADKPVDHDPEDRSTLRRMRPIR